MAETIVLHQGYGSSGCLYDDLDDIVAAAVERLSDDLCDTLVGTGMSGSIVVPMIAKALDLNFLLIRKDGAGAHTDSHVGRLGERWIFVDDFISSGATKERVVKAIADVVNGTNRYRPAEWPKFATTFVGSYLYATWDGPTWLPADENPTGCSCPACKGAEPF